MTAAAERAAMPAPGPPAWRVHLLTVDATLVSLRTAPAPSGAPWVASRGLRGLDACGARPLGRPDVLGSGRGVPLLTRHRLGWRGLELHLECHHDPDGDEVRLELPPWDQLVEAPQVDETATWELVDTLAWAVDAVDGTVGDGEGPGGRAGVLHRPAVPGAYTMLERSGLALVLR